MADLNHSHRSLERATYTPYRTQQNVRPNRRAWEKWSYIAALAPTRAEFALALDTVLRDPSKPAPADVDRLRLLQPIIPETPESARSSISMEGTPLLADVPPQTLLLFGQAITSMRKAAFDAGNAALQAVVAAAQKAASAPPPAPAITVSPQLKLNPNGVVARYPGAQVFQFQKTEALAADVQPTAPAGTQPKITGALGTVGIHSVSQVQLVKRLSSPPIPPAFDASTLSIGQLLRTPGLDQKVLDDTKVALDLGVRHGIASKDITVEGFQRSASTALTLLQDLHYAYGKSIQIEPIGMLHLERLQFIPSGIERGELSYSVPLSPVEQVNISHKEWANTSTEFQDIVTDFLENYSEQGVAEKSELTQSTNSQSQHSSGFSMGVTASGGFGPVSISTSASFNMTSSASNSEQLARQSSNEITKKASSRSKKEHKMSFKVASASGTEDQAVRLIRNPFTDKCTRVDYYQMIRRWRVDLLRYGARLTYDLAIPEPGAEILSKIVQINQLTDAIQQGFNAPATTLSWARFDLSPQAVHRDNYMALAAQYGVPVDVPPADQINYVRSFNKQWPGGEDASKDDSYTSFDVAVPDGYDVTGLFLGQHHWKWDDAHFEINTDINNWFGRTGTLTFTVGSRHISAFDIEMNLTFTLTDEAYQAWQMKVWGQLRDAALARYESNRASLQNQLSALQAQLGAQDALSLRQIEREEVMKLVLRWLFGPSFTFVPPGLPPGLYGKSESVVSNAVWGKVLAQGEIIKFLHQAIEWENMIYFLYPYFWSHASRWELKKYLDHPDFMHRSFLRSGSARVVLTIRPGFEKDFASYLETGKFDALSEGHPYLTIAEEMQAYAQTNYPNLPSANPDQSARPLLSTLQRRAWDDMQGIMGLLEKYKQAHNAYPATAQGLAALAPFGSVPAADPWGHDYSYTSPGKFANYELISLGADGAPGGDDENAAITSYAEASLIGRWYEFTPTNALDIAFNEILPSA